MKAGQGVLQTVLYLLYPIVTIGVFIYFFVIAIIRSENRRRNLAFLLTTLAYFTLLSVAITVLIYGSGYSMHWDYSRLQWGEGFSPFPITLDNSGQSTSTDIPKTSPTFWLLTFLGTSFYVSLPQAIVRGLNLRIFAGATAIIVGTVSNVVSIGEGFLAFLLTVTAAFAPFPATNVPLMLVSFVFIFLISGYDLSGLGIGSFFLKPVALWLRYQLQRALALAFKIVVYGPAFLLAFGIGASIFVFGLDLYTSVTHHPKGAGLEFYIVLIFFVIALAIFGGIFLFLYSLINRWVVTPFQLWFTKLLSYLGIEVLTQAEASE